VSRDVGPVAVASAAGAFGLVLVSSACFVLGFLARSALDRRRRLVAGVDELVFGRPVIVDDDDDDDASLASQQQQPPPNTVFVCLESDGDDFGSGALHPTPVDAPPTMAERSLVVDVADEMRRALERRRRRQDRVDDVDDGTADADKRNDNRLVLPPSSSASSYTSSRPPTTHADGTLAAFLAQHAPRYRHSKSL
jgi:hypothetical protein